MKTFLSIFIFFAFVSNTYCTDITGHWIGTINGQFDVSYDFKMDGDKLTGTTAGQDGTAIAIKDGMLKDDDISWSIDVMGSTIKVKGKLIDNVMKLNFTYDGNEISFDLKKVDK